MHVRFRPTEGAHLGYLLSDMNFPRTASRILRARQPRPSFFALVVLSSLLLGNGAAQPPQVQGSEQDRAAILHLDDEYQAAVKRNDSATMASHLSDDYMLLSSSGKVYFKPDMLAEAKSGAIVYEIQEDSDRNLRFYGPQTAVLTGKLHEKGTQDGKAFDVWVLFSDVYVRTDAGWTYVYAQAVTVPAPVK